MKKNQSIAIIDYNAGNIQSVLFAMHRIGAEATVTADHTIIRNADKVIFPGVGEASTTMAHLRSEGLDEVIRGLTQPVLGVCVGMQLLCEHSEENDTECLGVIPQKVKIFRPKNGEKVPHMGWNRVYDLKGDIFDTRQEEAYVYYVHSFYVEEGPYTVGLTDYVHPFSAAVQKDNFYATQFHVEKSGSIGEQILRNFINL